MKYTIEYKGKNYTIRVTKDDNEHFSCFIEEINQCFYVNSEDEIMKKGNSFIEMWVKHNATWGIKNLKTKVFKFSPFKSKLVITLMTPYASKSWFWQWHKAKNIKAFTLRICGINIYWSEPNATEKLNKAISEGIK